MGVANQQLIRHDPLTSPIGLPDHLSFDLSGWRYRRINPVVLRPTEPFLRGKPLSCAFLCLVRQLRVDPDRRVRGTRKRIQSLASWHRPTPKAPQQTKATPSEYTVFDKPKTPCSPIGYTFYLTNWASTHYPTYLSNLTLKKFARRPVGNIQDFPVLFSSTTGFDQSCSVETPMTTTMKSL